MIASPKSVMRGRINRFTKMRATSLQAAPPAMAREKLVRYEAWIASHISGNKTFRSGTGSTISIAGR